MHILGAPVHIFGDNETLKDKLQAVQHRAEELQQNEIFFQFLVCFEVTLYKHMYVTKKQRLKMARPTRAETDHASSRKVSYKSHI